MKKRDIGRATGTLAAAKAGGATLLLDEAGAILGKRSEVKDAHDRYANIETDPPAPKGR